MLDAALKTNKYVPASDRNISGILIHRGSYFWVYLVDCFVKVRNMCTKLLVV
jgi:hypothetical protein